MCGMSNRSNNLIKFTHNRTFPSSLWKLAKPRSIKNTWSFCYTFFPIKQWHGLLPTETSLEFARHCERILKKCRNFKKPFPAQKFLGQWHRLRNGSMVTSQAEEHEVQGFKSSRVSNILVIYSSLCQWFMHVNAFRCQSIRMEEDTMIMKTRILFHYLKNVFPLNYKLFGRQSN